jgi:hypothetical protein
VARSLDLDELVEHWTLLADEQELIAGKRGPTRLAFALLLKFYTRAGRFPRGRGELPDEAVEFVAGQVGVDPNELGIYEWSGSTIAYHRAQIRTHLGFRECSVADADKLTEWLAANVCEAERRPELIRDELLVRCRAERIEPPAAGRVDRIVRSAMHQAEQKLTARIVGRLPVDVGTRQRKPGLDALRDPQAARRPRDRPTRRAVRRRRAARGGRLAGPCHGGVPVTPA